ncbi:MAG: hypothetical protein ACFFDT_23885 [Candidatus Hodarchaeota archaeon]
MLKSSLLTSRKYGICLVTIIFLGFAMITLSSHTQPFSSIAKDCNPVLTNDPQVLPSEDTQPIKPINRMISSSLDNNLTLPMIDGSSLFLYLQQHLDTSITATDKVVGFPTEVGGIATATATMEGMIALKILGKFRSLFGNDPSYSLRQNFENYVSIELEKTEDERIGYADKINASSTIQGTFGVLSALDLMGRLESYLNIQGFNRTFIEFFVFDHFNIETGGFAEMGEESALSTTLQALEILNYIGFNFSILKNYIFYNTTTNIDVLANITNFLENDAWDDTEEIFNDTNAITSPIADAWYATEILALLGINDDFVNNTVKPRMKLWIPSLQAPYNESSSQYGGIGWDGEENIVDSAYAIGILFNLGIIDQTSINITNLQKFVVKSQYLPDTGTGTDTDYKGGFRKSPTASRTSCSIDTAYSALTLLLFSGLWRDTIEIVLSTDDSEANQWNTARNEILQNENSSIYIGITTLNYTFHRDLSVDLKVENWTIIKKELDFQNRYNFFIDINNQTFPLGLHNLTANFSISDLSFLSNPLYSFNDTINVRYDIDLSFDTSITSLTPGSSFEFNATILTGLLPGTDETLIYVDNETASIGLTTPAKSPYDPNVSSSLLSITAGKLTFIPITLPEDGLLGKWNFTFSVGSHSLNIYYLRLSDTTNVYFNDTQTANFSYYLGTPITFNMTFSYNSSGRFPTMVNGSVIFHTQGQTYFEYNITHNYNQTFTLVNATVPTDQGFILGEYNMTIILQWDEYGGTVEYLQNHNQSIIIKGKPIALNAEVRKNNSLLVNNTINVYYGDQISTIFALGSFDTDNEIIPVSNVRAIVGIGDINGTLLTTFSGTRTNDTFFLNPSQTINETHNYTDIISPNLRRSDTYCVAIYVYNELNESRMMVSAFSYNLSAPILKFNQLRLNVSGTFGIVQGSRFDITSTQLNLDKDVCFITYFKVQCNETGFLLPNMIMNATVLHNDDLVYEIPIIGYSVEDGYYLLIIPINTLFPGDYKIKITAIVDGTIVSDQITFSIFQEEEEEDFPIIEVITVIIVIANLIIISWTYRIWVKGIS